MQTIKFRDRCVILFLAYYAGAAIGSLAGSLFSPFWQNPSFFERVFIFFGIPVINLATLLIAPLVVIGTFRLQNENERMFSMAVIPADLAVIALSIFLLKSKQLSAIHVLLVVFASLVFNLCYVASNVIVLGNRL